MKKHMLIVSAILILIAVGIAFAGALEGYITAINDTRNSFTVKSDANKKEYKFECDKDIMPSSIKIKDHVAVEFKQEGDVKKVTNVKKAPI